MSEPIPASEKQVKLLESYKYDTTGLTIGEASKLIDAIVANGWKHPETGYAPPRKGGGPTWKMKRALMMGKYTKTEVDAMTFDTAKAALAELQANDWKRPEVSASEGDLDIFKD